MRPQDVVVLLKVWVVQQRQEPARQVDLAQSLFLSQSEVSASLDRSRFSGLLSQDKQQVNRKSLFDFLVYGVKYAFPVKPGPVQRGLPTAHAAPPLSALIVSAQDQFVWPDEQGTIRGQVVEPLYHTVPKAARQDPDLYQLLALVDALRVGKAREVKLAREELQKLLLHEKAESAT